MLNRTKKTKIKIIRKISNYGEVDLHLVMNGTTQNIVDTLAECIANFCLDKSIPIKTFKKILDNTVEDLEKGKDYDK